MKLTAAIALVLALSACASGGATSTTQPAATTSTTSTAAVPPVTTQAPTTTQAQSTTTTTTTAPDTRPAFDTWIAVMASLPVSEFTEVDAEARSQEIAAPDSGILRSDDYPSLNPGFWVVYSGEFEFDWEAQQRCEQLGGDCYRRYLGDDPAIAPTLANDRVLVWLDGKLVAVDTTTGAVMRTVSDSWGDGRYTGSPHLTSDGTTAYFDTFAEDSWFSCESTLGGFSRMDLVSGEAEFDKSGILPNVSPRGDLLAYASADECLPDPAEAQFFIAYHNTVTVRDLNSGVERSWRAAAGVNPDDSPILSIGWSADAETLYVALADGSIRLLPLTTPTSTPIQELEALEYFLDHGTVRVEVIGELTTGELVMWSVTDGGDEFRAHIDLYDPASESATTLVSAPAAFASIDSTATTVLYGDEHTVWAAGGTNFELTFDRYVGGAGG